MCDTLVQKKKMLFLMLLLLRKIGISSSSEAPPSSPPAQSGCFTKPTLVVAASAGVTLFRMAVLEMLALGDPSPLSSFPRWQLGGVVGSVHVSPW